MRRTSWLAPALAALALGVLPATWARAGAAGRPGEKDEKPEAAKEETPGPKTEAKKEEAAASCGDCHEQAAAFTSNPHARGHRKAGEKTPLANAACEACHGDGTKHIESGGDKSLIRVLQGRAGAETCVTCHTRSAEHASFRNGVHASSERVNCLSCHAIHKADRKEPRLLVSSSLALCESCHAGQAAAFRSLPFAHRLKAGSLTCVSCHVVHGQAGGHAVKQTRGGEPACVTCHSGTRGPFVFPHVQGVAGDCATCHRPHGSSFPHMLTRAAVSQQCLECHSTLSTATLGAQPPSTHNLSLPRWQNCTVCHTAVHGSNRSPQLLK